MTIQLLQWLTAALMALATLIAGIHGEMYHRRFMHITATRIVALAFLLGTITYGAMTFGESFLIRFDGAEVYYAQFVWLTIGLFGVVWSIATTLHQDMWHALSTATCAALIGAGYTIATLRDDESLRSWYFAFTALMSVVTIAMVWSYGVRRNVHQMFTVIRSFLTAFILLTAVNWALSPAGYQIYSGLISAGVYFFLNGLWLTCTALMCVFIPRACRTIDGYAKRTDTTLPSHHRHHHTSSTAVYTSSHTHQIGEEAEENDAMFDAVPTHTVRAEDIAL